MKVACALTLGCLVGLSQAVASERRVGWWWDAVKADPETGPADLLNFCRDHTDIVSSVFMLCGPTTANGTVTGDMSPLCIKVLPELKKLGIESELWLTQTNTLDAALSLFSQPEVIASSLIEFGNEYPDLTGFNFDLEVGGATECGDKPCDVAYSQFLGTIRDALHTSDPGRWRLTADASCSPEGETGWAPMMSNCTLLAEGADVVIDMKTYNAKSYEEWMGRAQPPLDLLASVTDPTQVGFGLGCWVEPKINNTWSTDPVSAHERICTLMNHSVMEVDMFRFKTTVWPEPWWIPELELFMQGGGCEL